MNERTTTFVVIRLMLAVAGLIGVYSIVVHPMVSKKLNSVHVSDLKETLARCRDMKVCIGGFIKLRDRTYPARLSDCNDNCPRGTFSLRRVMEMTDATLLNEVAYITLPNAPYWSRAEAQYELQFIRRSN